MSDALAVAKAVIRAAQSSVTVKEGEMVTVEITHTSRNASLQLVSRTAEPGIVSCSWNKWTSQSTTSLSITGMADGRTRLVTVGIQ